MSNQKSFIDKLAAPEDSFEAENTVTEEIPEEAKGPLNQLWEIEADDKAEEFDEETENDYFVEDEDSQQEDNEDENTDESEESEDEDDSEDEEVNDKKEEEDEEDEEDVENPEWADMMIELYPDREFNSPEDYDKAVSEHLHHLNTEIQTRDQAHKDLIDIFNNYPQFAAMVNALKDGDSDRVALIKAGYSPEDFTIDENDDDAEKLVEAKINLKNQRIAEQKRKDEIRANIQASQKHLDTFKQKNNIPDDQWEEFNERMDSTVKSFMNGKITPKEIQHFWEGLNYKKDTEKAVKEGEIKGKNKKIVAEKLKRKGDGIPNLSRGSSRNDPRDKNSFAATLEKSVSSRPKSLIDALSRN
jgi:hypothetical protein